MANSSFLKHCSYLLFGLLVLSCNSSETPSEAEGIKESEIAHELKMVIPLDEFIRISSNDSDNEYLNACIQASPDPLKTKSGAYFDQFLTLANELDSFHLAPIFTEAQPKAFSQEMTNIDVVDKLKLEYKKACNETLPSLKQRLKTIATTNKFNIRLNELHQFEVSLDANFDPEYIEQNLETTGKLGFYEVYSLSEIFKGLADLNASFGRTLSLSDKMKMTDEEIYSAENPLLDKLIIEFDENGSISRNTQKIGQVSIEDSALVSQMLFSPGSEQFFPEDLQFVFAPNMFKQNKKVFYDLYAIKVPLNMESLFSGKYVSSANADFDMASNPIVMLKFSSKGSKKWAELTKKNIGKAIAIVMDGIVLSAPIVQEEITGGSASISGNYTFEEALELANIIQSGALPYPVRVISSTKLH